MNGQPIPDPHDLVMVDIAMWAPVTPALCSAAVEWIALRKQVNSLLPEDSQDRLRDSIQAAADLLCYLRDTPSAARDRAYRGAMDVFLILVEEWEAR